MPRLKRVHYILILIVFLSVILRFYKLDSIPPGFHQDEVSQSYNAFAIGTTGHDRYGQYFPILFRSFGSYQPSLYTYLASIPILLIGNTIFAARFLSALSGVVVVVLSYLIVVELTKKRGISEGTILGTITALMVGISPWAIQFSRRVAEGNLGLAIFLVAAYLFIRSMKLPKLFPLAALVMGISTQAYYSERVISIIFIPLFLIIFRQIYLKHKKLVFFGLILFCLTQLPHLWILTTGAYARRFTQVSYFNNDPGGLPRVVYLAREFTRYFLIYISPRNLFADTGGGLGRVSPDLGVFYSWLLVPFLVGMVYFLKHTKDLLFKIMILLAAISLIPASLTGDAFYPLRALEFLWVVSVTAALGIFVLLNRFKNRLVGLLLFAILTSYSLIAFYISQAVLLKYETTENVGKAYIELNERLKSYSNKNIIIDSQRDGAAGLRIAYLRAFSADKLASVLRPQLKSDYYSAEVAIQEVYKIDNIETRPIVWTVDPCLKNTILVGDTLAISDSQAEEHKLTPVFNIKGADDRVILRAYATNPDLKCKL